MSERHPELAAFQGGDTRQLWALDRDTGAIVHMEEGAADVFRAGCGVGRFICPIDGCPTPAFEAVGGASGRRHHFRHSTPGAGDHHGESWLHEMGKRWLGQELARRYPEARVFIDTRAVDNGQRPDVLVEFLDGGRFAFEVQYAPITVEHWRVRHDGYRQQGLVDVWLLGNLRPHFRSARQLPGECAVELGELHWAIRAANLPVRFISPDARAIGTALVESGSRWEGVLLQVDPLDDCSLAPDGFAAPADAREAAAVAERERRQQERERQEEQRRRETAERAAAEAEQQKRRAAARARHAQAAIARDRQWKATGEPRLLAALGVTSVPAILAGETKAEHCIDDHPVRWRSAVYYRHLHRRIGETFSYGDMARPFYVAKPEAKKWINRALTAFLFRLRDCGYVDFAAVDYWIESDILVLADVIDPPDAEFIKRLRRARLARYNDWLVVADSRSGEVLRPLRQAREEDGEVPEAQTIATTRVEREQQAREAWQNRRPRYMRNSENCFVWRQDGRLVVEIMASAYQMPFRSNLHRYFEDHPGDTEIEFIVYPNRSGTTDPEHSIWLQLAVDEPATLRTIVTLAENASALAA